MYGFFPLLFIKTLNFTRHIIFKKRVKYNLLNSLQAKAQLDCRGVKKSLYHSSHACPVPIGRTKRKGGIQQLRGQNFGTFLPSPLCEQFLYRERGQKQTFFDPLPPHLVHVVIDCPLGGFQLLDLIILELKSHVIPYKFKSSHWLKLQHSDWRANLVKDFFYKNFFHQ